MSDNLSEAQKSYLDYQLHLILPVISAVILVIVVYVFGFGAPAPPPLTPLVNEVVTTKKERANAKKKAKQQEKVEMVKIIIILTLLNVTSAKIKTCYSEREAGQWTGCN